MSCRPCTFWIYPIRLPEPGPSSDGSRCIMTPSCRYEVGEVVSGEVGAALGLAWQEGAVLSTHHAIERIARQIQG
jgi:hypothetical protein